MSTSVKVIKKYQNRKLYDVHSHCYVTLKEVFSFYQSGSDVQVICNKSKVDITKQVLIQAAVEFGDTNETFSKLFSKESV